MHDFKADLYKWREDARLAAVMDTARRIEVKQRSRRRRRAARIAALAITLSDGRVVRPIRTA